MTYRVHRVDRNLWFSYRRSWGKQVTKQPTIPAALPPPPTATRPKTDAVIAAAPKEPTISAPTTTKTTAEISIATASNQPTISTPPATIVTVAATPNPPAKTPPPAGNLKPSIVDDAAVAASSSGSAKDESKEIAMNKPSSDIIMGQISGDPSAPIILSNAGWASSHPGLLKLVQEFKTLFAEECDDRVDPKKSIAVNRVIQKLVKEYAPKILLETTDETAALKHSQLSYGDILIGGSYHSMMAKKVKECFERQSLETAGTFGAESPPPKPFPVSQSPGSESPVNSTSSGVKRLLSTKTKKGGTAKKTALSTPMRGGEKHDLSAEKTPIAGNKKLRQTIKEAILPRSASRAASRQAKRLMQEIPTANRRYVRADQLTVSYDAFGAPDPTQLRRFDKLSFDVTSVASSSSRAHSHLCYVCTIQYDWSSLRIDGTAAWNRFLLERSDPRIELQPPVVTPMDTYQLVQSVKAGLATTTPPPGSYLYDALSDSFDPKNKPETPKTQLMQLFRDMADYETSGTSKRKQSYQFMKATEVRDHLVAMEKDIAELNEIGNQLEDKDECSTSDGAVGPKRIRKAADMKEAPVFWQADFAALFENKGPATRYLMPQDQY
jgi:hypothetical protein